MTDTQTTQRRRGRPRKDQESRNETRQLLIRSGLEMLTEKGYSATGIDEILKRVNVPKGSFYHYFTSKDAYIVELISAYARFFQHKLDKALLNKTQPPLARVQSFVEDAIQGMARYKFKRGCLVGNLGQEMQALPEPFRQQLIDVFEDWQQRLAVCLIEAQQMGELNQNVDCAESAYLFWIGWEGAVLRSRLEQSDRAMRHFADAFMEQIKR